MIHHLEQDGAVGKAKPPEREEAKTRWDLVHQRCHKAEETMRAAASVLDREDGRPFMLQGRVKMVPVYKRLPLAFSNRWPCPVDSGNVLACHGLQISKRQRQAGPACHSFPELTRAKHRKHSLQAASRDRGWSHPRLKRFWIWGYLDCEASINQGSCSGSPRSLPTKHEPPSPNIPQPQ